MPEYSLSEAVGAGMVAEVAIFQDSAEIRLARPSACWSSNSIPLACPKTASEVAGGR
jgi:hypothetical protein